MKTEDFKVLLEAMDAIKLPDNAWDDLLYSCLHAHDDGTWHPMMCCFAPKPCSRRQTWLELAREVDR